MPQAKRSTTTLRRRARGPIWAMSASCAWPREAGAAVRVRPIDLGSVFPVSRAGCRWASGRRNGRPTGWSTLRGSPRPPGPAAEPQAQVLPGGRRRRGARDHRGRPARRHRGGDAHARRCSRRCGRRSATSATRTCWRTAGRECGLPASAWSTRRARRCRSATTRTRRKPSTSRCSARRATCRRRAVLGAGPARFRRAGAAPLTSILHPIAIKEHDNMGQFIDLKAADGLTFPAYVAEPAGKPPARWSWCRKSSASTRTSARWPTAMRPKATWPWRRPPSTA
jgi:hypothetical protein